MKVTIIEEAQDISTMKVDELFGSLLTFEMPLDKVLKHFKNRSRNYVPRNVKANGASSEKLKKSQIQKKDVDNSSISDQNKYHFCCRECEGFSHYQSECPNFLKRRSKNKVLSLFEEDFEDSSEFEDVKALVNNITKDIHLCKSQEEDYSGCGVEEDMLESIEKSYRMLHQQWLEDVKVLDVQKERIRLFLRTIIDSRPLSLSLNAN